MPKRCERKKTLKWTEIDPKIVLAAADVCDGHTILDPKAFVDAGVPQELIDRCTNVYESNFSDPKYTISGPDGKPVNQMRGIYGLDALESMVRDFELPHDVKFGRGFQARVYQEALHKHLDAAVAT
jgi:hypothetical protein